MVLVIHGEDFFASSDGLEWSMVVKRISKQEVEGLYFVIRVIKDIQDGLRNTKVRSSSKLDLLKCLNERWVTREDGGQGTAHLI